MTDPRIVIRPLAETDAAALLAWRNDPTAYRWFRDARPLSDDEHKRWMTSHLADDPETVWVADLGGVPAGCVRLEQGDCQTVEVSIVVDRSARGSGVGSALLAHCIAQARLRALGAISAEVNVANGASLGLFTGSGFQTIGHDGEFVRLRLI